MSNSFILTTSGFILPQNQYFIILTKDNISEVSIFNRTSFVNADDKITDMIDSNQLYHSSVFNDALQKFIGTKDFDDFINLVNLASEVLSKINFDTFFALQANNRHNSPYTINFCRDVLKGDFISKKHQYETLPHNVRFSPDNGLTEQQAVQNSKIVRESKRKFFSNWENLLSELANDKNAFCTFFKYVFADSY